MPEMKRWRELYALAGSEPQSCADALSAVIEGWQQVAGIGAGEDARREVAMAWRLAARLRSGGFEIEQLRESLEARVNKHGPIDTPTPESFNQLLLDLEKYAIGPRRRVLFPVVCGLPPDWTGHLVWADVAVIDLGRLQADREQQRKVRESDSVEAAVPAFWSDAKRIAIAPWSFYTYGAVLQIPVYEVLRALPEPKRIDRSLGFLVDFQPLTEGDVKPDTDEHVLDTLNCPVMEITGPSLGLALGIAGYTAVHHLMPAPVIATGQLSDDGSVAFVDGTDKKLAAAEVFRANSAVQWTIFVPPGANVPARIEVVKADHIADLLQPGAGVTDGFDEYLQHQKQPDGEPMKGEIWSTTRRDADAVVATFVRASVGQPIGVCYVTTPFDCPTDAGPGDDKHLLSVAQWLAWKLSPRDHSIKSERNLDRKIVVALSLDHYRQILGATPESTSSVPNDVLADWFAAAIRETYALPASLNYYRTAFLAALGRKGKLTLVVCDRASIALWKEIAGQQELTSYHALLCALRGLTATTAAIQDGDRPATDVTEPLRVVAVCSDIYHRNLWSAAGVDVQAIATESESVA